jgi:hypothetical protein
MNFFSKKHVKYIRPISLVVTTNLVIYAYVTKRDKRQNSENSL